MPKISIVIPAYNVGSYLQECLDSVRNQTFSDIEAIVVNDASTDDVAQIAEAAATQDPRIRVIANNPNMGTHRTRMAGAEAATGEYTFFLDGDDALKPDMCEQLVQELSQHPVDILHYGLTVIGANDLLQSEQEAFEAFRKKFADAIRDDLNTSMALTIVYDVVKADISEKTKLALLNDFDQVLALNLTTAGQERLDAGTSVDAELEQFINEKIAERAGAKKAKDFARADAIRDELLARGVTIKDTREGVVWERNA